MHLEEYFDFAEPDVIRIKGHRLGIEHLIKLFNEGYSPEDMAQFYPGLELGKIYAVLTYYLQNRAEMDAYVHRIEELAEVEYQTWRANPSLTVERLRALRDRLKAA